MRVDLSPGDTDTLDVTIPPTRSDILHECDIMEDAAIAYGFNNLPDVFPATSTVAQPLAVSKLSDIIRHEWAYAGWVEVLPLILVCIPHSLAPPPPPNDLSLSCPVRVRAAVLPRRKLFLAPDNRRRPNGNQDREPENARVPSSAHVAPAGPAQDDPGEPVARTAAAHLRDVRRRVQRRRARAPGAQRAACCRRVVQQDGRV